MANVTLTQGHDGSVISAAFGDTITVELAESPATGFRWSMKSSNAGLILQADHFKMDETVAVGGQGMRVFELLASIPGKTRFQFTLSRAWEPGLPKAAFGFDILVV